LSRISGKDIHRGERRERREKMILSENSAVPAIKNVEIPFVQTCVRTYVAKDSPAKVRVPDIHPG
jgi:hypothetical protein